VTLSAVGLVVAGVPAVPASATTIGTDQQSIAQLEQQITAQGAKAQSLVARYNQVQARVDLLNTQIAQNEQLVATDQREQAKATSAIQRVAVAAYISGRGTDSTLQMFNGTWSVSRMLEQDQYLVTANSRLDEMVATLSSAESGTRDAQRVLQSEEAQAKKTLDELTAAHDAATTAIASDEAHLGHVKGDLRVLVAAANQEEHEEQLAAERALARATPTPSPGPPVSPVPSTAPAPAAPLPPPSSPQPPSSPSPSPSPSPPQASSGGYANPLRGASGLSPERIDQGVDYSGFGPVYAIGDGVVRNTVSAGWPGGTFIAYQLTDGAASGLVVYVAEDLEPDVQVGQTVTSGTVIGQMYAGPDGIETGWANGASLPDTMARDAGQFNGTNSSAFGVNFSQLLQALGAPGGIQNGPASGVLPPGWPRW
jgi:murein DD-endopeptidase MepM/ murein hydrolase activator NlpD